MENDPMREKVLTALFVALVCACLVAVFSGCKTVNRQVVEQATVDPVTGATYRDRMEQVNSAGPFGKAEALQDARWQYAPGEFVALGSDASADNTAQVQAVQVAGDLAARVIAAVLSSGIALPGAGAPAGGGEDGGALGRLTEALGRVEALTAQLERLRELYGGALPTRPKSAVGPAVPPR